MILLETRCAWDWGLISAESEEDIPAAVRRHQATYEHKDARRRIAYAEHQAQNKQRKVELREAVRLVRLAREMRREQVA